MIKKIKIKTNDIIRPSILQSEVKISNYLNNKLIHWLLKGIISNELGGMQG
jgi:hypothetical protein